MLVTVDDFADVMNWFDQQPAVAFDTETTGLRPFHGDHLVGISVGVGNTTAYFPFRHEAGPNLPEARLRDVIHLLETRPQLVGHNTKFDLHFLMREGFKLPSHSPIDDDCPILDTLIGAHLANENERTYALKQLCNRYDIGRGSKDEEELKDRVVSAFSRDIANARKDGAELKGSTDGVWKGFMWKLSPEQVAPYACADVELTWGLLTEYVWPHLHGEGLVPLFHKLCQYNLLITKMEARGILVDQERLERLTIECQEAAEAAENDLWLYTNGQINNSNSSAQALRYFRQKYPPLESTREMPLNYAVMEGNVDAKAAELLLSARGRRKVVESYLLPYHRFVAKDGAIHPGFKVHGTATGRLSCSDPNIMALPRDVRDQPAKSVFVARPGYVLAEIDLSQAELRVASHFCAQIAQNMGDKEQEKYLRAPELSKMGYILHSGDDLHTVTMEMMQAYNPSFDRNIAKRINLSAIFGIGAKKFSTTYAVPFEKSKEALKAWREIYPEFMMLYSLMDELATGQGYITFPISGRMRRYTDSEGNYPSKASSNVVQGTVADVMRLAMHSVDNYLEEEEGHLLLQVHDSLLVEIPNNGRYHEIVEGVRERMTDFNFMPRLKTEAKVGLSWGDLIPHETRHDEIGAKV